MSSSKDHKPYTIPYTGSAAVPVDGGYIPSSKVGEVATASHAQPTSEGLSHGYYQPRPGSFVQPPTTAANVASPSTSSRNRYHRRKMAGPENGGSFSSSSASTVFNPHSTTTPIEQVPPAKFSQVPHEPKSFVGMPAAENSGVVSIPSEEIERLRSEQGGTDRVVSDPVKLGRVHFAEGNAPPQGQYGTRVIHSSATKKSCGNNQALEASEMNHTSNRCLRQEPLPPRTRGPVAGVIRQEPLYENRYPYPYTPYGSPVRGVTPRSSTPVEVEEDWVIVDHESGQHC